MQVKRIKEAFESIDTNAEGDDAAISSGARGPLDPALLTAQLADGKPKVRLYRSKVASCKGGQFLVRTTDARLAKRDNFAYVPYLTSDEGSDSGVAGDAEATQGYNTVLKVTDLFSWHQATEEGGLQVYRFALGTMYALDAVGRKDYGYELNYTDGSSGGRVRKPSLLRKRHAALGNGPVGYQYGVWLDKIDCTLVSTKNEQYFIPTLKLCSFG